MKRCRIEIEGIVQGVGFRPFVYQLARRHHLAGWVLNDSRGVTIEAQGDTAAMEDFLHALRAQAPPLAVITRFKTRPCPLATEDSFVIHASNETAERRIQIAPDTYVCGDCLAELFDPADRRYRYPFINCTNCGPRYTIVTGVPYDRPLTTMADFPLCADCRREYENPASRRFHAQPNACPACGPRLSLHDGAGRRLEVPDALGQAIALLRQGRILAVKGLGGYHLVVDAANDQAVAELRRRKTRDEKPFALMSRDLEAVRRYAWVNEAEEQLLLGVERPIVLLPRRADHGLSPRVAPSNGFFGVMLPYTPLHHLLLEDQFTALVMTSANLSDEPILFEDGEALTRLSDIADAYLSHNRRIHTRTDDSIARILAGRAVLMRRSRGYVPRGILLPQAQPTVLALGAELKNTICFTQENRAFLSQHIGDLKNLEVLRGLEHSVDHLGRILGLRPRIVAHDLHPDYLSTRFAEELPEVRRIGVQHHHAHLVSCLADNGRDEPAIGVIFDGLGFGADGHIWGGEFLLGDADGFERAAHLAYLPMPGGDAATREPWRMALSALAHAFGESLPEPAFFPTHAPGDLRLVRQMIARGINCPLTSSCGRLFDAVAALIGVRQRISYEGQAALELEQIAAEGEQGRYAYELYDRQGPFVVDPAPLIRSLVEDLGQGVAPGVLSARFHNTLAAMIQEVCGRLREGSGLNLVALSGGVFQNRYLTEKTLPLLERDGFTVLTHSLVPPNDGGLALGQAVIAGRLAARQQQS
ncbi:carbamoyltransferase HypF [Geoalkalibacter halelectricus]|uniref:Carbamoyltransferase n=1 Tax=Geoalkalibacter halelectricus TaxID=2847045 RepID=A0ABY5ZTM2_9BACT|nr:carbamoyltransferase HypF [Geoalkalibacter halelectricus]MDO3379261.1 carbamoyltransferase HypF [Geoalkalibacter halelectricus]UWZ81019.1 carbamoyltransferase HypF [Geoalkalibacter halelectricus]